MEVSCETGVCCSCCCDSALLGLRGVSCARCPFEEDGSCVCGASSRWDMMPQAQEALRSPRPARSPPQRKLHLPSLREGVAAPLKRHCHSPVAPSPPLASHRHPRHALAHPRVHELLHPLPSRLCCSSSLPLAPRAPPEHARITPASPLPSLHERLLLKPLPLFPRNSPPQKLPRMRKIPLKRAFLFGARASTRTPRRCCR